MVLFSVRVSCKLLRPYHFLMLQVHINKKLRGCVISLWLINFQRFESFSANVLLYISLFYFFTFYSFIVLALLLFYGQILITGYLQTNNIYMYVNVYLLNQVTAGQLGAYIQKGFIKH